MIHLTRSLIVLGFVVAALSGAGWAAPAGGVVGTGSAASCDDAALTSALSGGGQVIFNGSGNCSPLDQRGIPRTNACDTPAPPCPRKFWG
jgi:hypothetical protein